MTSTPTFSTYHRILGNQGFIRPFQRSEADSIIKTFIARSAFAFHFYCCVAEAMRRILRKFEAKECMVAKSAITHGAALVSKRATPWILDELPHEFSFDFDATPQ